jgi:NAD(P)-dependent dehydrogenase (short-subunit alcohol dehydrogenase family)
MRPDMHDMHGVNVVITGGAGGLGLATARAFLQAGARVVLGDIDLEAARQVLDGLGAEPGRAHAVACDIADPDACEALVRAAEARFGAPLDVFVANAGRPFGGKLLEARPQDIRRVVDVNVTGTIFSAQAALRSLVRSPRACLLFTASLQSVAGRAERSVYTASKHAIAGLVKSLALELGPLGVRVNGIAPTVVDTPFLRQAYEQAGVAVEAGLRKAAAGLPLGRIPTADDFAQAALFLASPAASAITGHLLMVDCGATAGKF